VRGGSPAFLSRGLQCVHRAADIRDGRILGEIPIGQENASNGSFRSERPGLIEA